MFCRKAYFLLIVCYCFTISNVFAQEQKIADSLAAIYEQDTLKGKAKFELLIDLSFHEVKDLNKSIQYAEELIRLAKQTGNNRYLRVGFFLKGTKKRLQGKLDEALKAYITCAEIARHSNDKTGEGEAYSAIADIYVVTKHFPNALVYYHKAIAELKRPGVDSINLASVLLNAGNAYLITKSYDSAFAYFNEAKVIFDKLDYESGIGYSLGNLGMVYANIGKDNLAENNLNEAIRILEGLQDYYPICDFLLSMADVYLNKGKAQMALEYARRSLLLAQKNSLIEQISVASLKLSEIYESNGNIGAAFEHYKDHIVYRDSFKSINTIQKMADEIRNFEVSQKQQELDRVQKEKKSQQIIVVFLFIILGLAILLLAALFWFYKSKNREKVRLHQQELLHARLEIQEQTYRNISQELHDNIGQVLSLAKLNINTIDFENANDTKGKLKESKNLISKAIQDIRDLSKSLNTDYLSEIGLANAVHQQLDLLKKTGVYSTKFIVEGNVHHFEPERELLVFRIVQELLNNIVKHAEANQINVTMQYLADKLVFKLWDNGKGFDMRSPSLNTGKGLGLRNIYHRIKLVNGTILFDSEPNNGTTAVIELLK